MIEEKYQELLKTAPEDHKSEEFLDFLRQNNNVVWENAGWLVIDNCKYGEGWRTAFFKWTDDDVYASRYMHEVYAQYPECKIIIKAPAKRSVKRFHFHIISENYKPV